jgi:hypothetical protein
MKATAFRAGSMLREHARVSLTGRKDAGQLDVRKPARVVRVPVARDLKVDIPEWEALGLELDVRVVLLLVVPAGPLRVIPVARLRATRVRLVDILVAELRQHTLRRVVVALAMHLPAGAVGTHRQRLIPHQQVTRLRRAAATRSSASAQ